MAWGGGRTKMGKGGMRQWLMRVGHVSLCAHAEWSLATYEDAVGSGLLPWWRECRHLCRCRRQPRVVTHTCS